MEIILDAFCGSVEIKRDALIALDPKDYAYTRIKGSINVDLRKLHDIGPHLCSAKAKEISDRQGKDIDFSSLRNGTKTKKLLGDDYVLQLEHPFPVNQTISLILRTSRGDSLRSLIQGTSCTAWILESEDKKIQERSFRSSPMKSYLNAGIHLLEKINGSWVEYDWSNIERWSLKSIPT